jgi:hypothetical protein
MNQAANLDIHIWKEKKLQKQNNIFPQQDEKQERTFHLAHMFLFAFRITRTSNFIMSDTPVIRPIMSAYRKIGDGRKPSVRGED